MVDQKKSKKNTSSNKNKKETLVPESKQHSQEGSADSKKTENLKDKKEASQENNALQENSPSESAVDSALTLDSEDENWMVKPSMVDFDSPLLNCLTLLSSLFQTPISKQALKSGLPNADTAFTPDICVRSAKRAGFNARIVSRDNLTDISALVLPCILLLKNKNACILLRFDKRKNNVEIMPAEGDGSTTKLSIEKLQEEYLGYAIFAKPTVKLDKRAAHLKLSERKDWFWGTLKKFWPIYSHVLIASLLINLFALASPLFVMNVYDRVVPNNATETLWVLAIGVTIVYIFDFLLKNLRSYFVDTAGKNTDTIIGSKLLEQIMGLRMDQMPPSIGSMASNVKDFEGLRDFFSSGTVTILVDLPFLFLFLGVIWMIAGPVAFVPLAVVPLVIIVGFILQIPLSRIIEKSHAESNQKYALLFEALSGLETIKTNTAESKVQGMWERIVNITAQSSAETRTLTTLATSFTGFMIQLTTVIVIIYGVYLISEGDMTMGALVAASMLTGRAMAPLGSISGLLARYQQTKMGLTALDEIMKKTVERPISKKFINLDSIQGMIEFKNVSFQYPESEVKVLDNVSFMIRPGEKVGILGRIGSGKSTIGRLLTGLYEPTEGSIQIDGTEIHQIDPADIRQNIGYVTQDNFLFFGSIRDNIAFGAPNVNQQAVHQAAMIAGVTDFVRKNPNGLDLQVGERGMSLSGGQRQSIAIARALLFDPPILLMDEPTSDMDLSSETRFIKRLDSIMQKKTMLLITHRHSVLRLVSRLIIVDDGKIIADGPKDHIINQLKEGKIKTPQ